MMQRICRTLGLTFLALAFLINIAFSQNDTLDASKQLQTLLDASVKESGVAGAVLLIESPSFKWLGSSGFANLATQEPLRPTDALRLASMTKTFVSVVILKLAEEGKLSLDDPLTKYLDNSVVEGIPNSAEISIRQLLNMTSGIINYADTDAYNDAIDANPYRSPWTAEEVLTYVYAEDPVFAPGEGWDYSNSNYILLDLLVKEISGTSLAAEMRRLIHTPLGLKDTFMEISEARAEGFGGLWVRGYDEDEEDVTEIQDAFGLGDGGLIATAEDVAAFLQALFESKTLLSDTSLNQMRDFHEIEEYGLGLEQRITDFGEAWGHNGSSAGFEGEMLFFSKENLSFVLLSNTTDTNLCELIFPKSLEIVLAN